MRFLHFIPRALRLSGLLLCGLVVVLVGMDSSAHAQTPDSTTVDPPTCAPGTAEAYLDVGNVRAKILNTGGLFFKRSEDGSREVYEVPKGSGLNAIYTASLLVTALVDGQLRATTGQYGPHEFWPGPHGTTDCLSADRIWEFRDGEPAPSDWPNARPRPPQLGHQMLLWTMNDLAGPHEFSDTSGVGLEVTGTAFAFRAAGLVGNTTFYRYQLQNMSPDTLRDMHIGLFVDADLGAAFDDYVGSDSSLGMGFFYNADDDDDGEYGSAPPAIGSVVLKRPSSTVLSGNASCQPPGLTDIGYTNHMMINKSGGGVGVGRDGLEFHHLMRSRDLHGLPLFEGRDVYDFRPPDIHPDTPVTRFGFAGDPVTRSYWSMNNFNGAGDALPPNDTRSVGSVGPVCLGPGDKTEIVFAFIWSRGSSNLDSVRQLRDDAAYILSIRDFLLSPRPQSEPELPDFSVLPFAASVYPNPVGSAGATVRLSTPEALEASVAVFNAVGQRVHVAAEPGVVAAGDHSWTLPTATWPPGVYLVRITAGHAVTTRRVVVVGGQ